MEDQLKHLIENEIESNNGILRLSPAWVARNFIPPGKRLGLPEEQYNLGARGGICERWIGSTTGADNKVGVPYEGLSFLKLDSGAKVTLKDAVDGLPEMILGKKYSRTHKGLKRLAKIFDYEDRLPYHIHQMQRHASLVGRNSKDEAYYFPENVDHGKHAETFFGVHPHIAESKNYDVLLPHLVEWKDDKILKHSFGYTQYPDDGFHVPSGTLHAPGSALTVELQEDSDVFAMMQAKVGNTLVSKELLWKDVRKEDREKYGEKIILKMINWKTSGDPEFYANRHTPPVLIKETKTQSGEEHWIFYNTKKFNGKKLIVHPGGKFLSKDNGVYNILVWQGKGNYGGFEIASRNSSAGKFDLDELIICHDRAVSGIEVVNDSTEDLIIYKFFGPDINPDVPMLHENI
ncbi:MAG TPA: hypothetical protein VLB50_11205 [Ignavibacteriaceae bacterium]|nr:hypothetical protein [Ignavibacteriaceae bacterium]